MKYWKPLKTLTFLAGPFQRKWRKFRLSGSSSPKMKSTPVSYTHLRPVYEERYLAGAVFELRAAETVTGGDGTVWFEQGELVRCV